MTALIRDTTARIYAEATRRIKALPLLLYSYIAAEMLAPFFASFVILYSIFFLVRLVPMLDIVLDLKIDFTDFIRMFSYLFPHMVFYVIPMASLIGVILAFTRLTSEREMLALNSCGISLRQLLPPVLLIALAISLLTAFISLKLIPAGNVAMKHLLFQMAKEKITKGLEERTFTEALGDLVVYVDSIDEDEQWNGVYISDMRERTQPLIIMAKRGRLAADLEKMTVTIVLGNGSIHNAVDQDNQTIRFQRYQLNIPLPNPTNVHGDNVTVLERGAMTQGQLLETARKKGVNTHEGVMFLTEYHERIVLPIGCFILSILGLPLGMQSGPGRRAIGIPLGLAFFIMFHVTATLGSILSEELVIPVAVGAWAPAYIMGALTLLIFRRVEQEKPIIPARALNMLLDLYEHILAPGFRKIRQAASWALHWGIRRVSPLSAALTDNMLIHADPEARVYHVKGCEFYDCPLCTIRFKNDQVAREAGFEPCGFCNGK